MSRPFFSIPSYHAHLPPALAEKLIATAQEVPGVPDLRKSREKNPVPFADAAHPQKEPGSFRGSFGLETAEAMRFLAELYDELKDDLARVLAQRAQDRKFIDERVKACFEFNREMGRDLLDPDYKTILGLEDGNGRVVFGPKRADYCRAPEPGNDAPIAPLPDFLKGPHVTLFGPPDTAKMAINAMNAFHRKLPNEPAIVEELLASGGASPMWGADDEDSKTPLHADLVEAGANLTACFDGTISLTEGAKKYELAKDRLALPIKRFPGLALPCTFLFRGRDPMPLHLYDFALHFHRNHKNPRALVFYVPKLENEEEAAYIRKMIASAERRIRAIDPSYREGTVRLMIVLENPRAIVRAHEIMDELHPYFAGASLGWHDYLASMARLYREDGNYRIPVKADPDIVIKYIKASHLLLAEAVGARGGIKVGGMYGILPIAGNEKSLQITLKGFIKDVVTQMKRDLTGFWVAHPDFVRLGLALVEAWRRRERGDKAALETLVKRLLTPEHHADILAFIEKPDVEGLDIDDPNYVRSLIVADIKESDYIPNNHPDEIRYNVFQSLQYLTDWLSGNGCVALPTVVDGVPVRVMDDLATAERSRWEVWHELRHGRFPIEDFVRIAHEEMNFIRRDLSDDEKIVQVKWDERTSKWYPIAFRLMLQLMTDPDPVEFAPELLLPFTIESIRAAADPWAAANEAAPGKYVLNSYVAELDHYYEICGSRRFAETMAKNAVEDEETARRTIMGFSLEEVIEAASFHGTIGDPKKVLDAKAAAEQAGVLAEDEKIKTELRDLGAKYLARFGVKFLIPAQGKSAAEIRGELERRLNLSAAEELEHARAALWEISRRRMAAAKRATPARFDELRRRHGLIGAAIAINHRGRTQDIALGAAANAATGAAPRPVTPSTAFEIASLSKTVATAFAFELFRERGIALTMPVNDVFAAAGSPFRLSSPKDPSWAVRTTLADLMSHSALNRHYVNGFPPGKVPPVAEIIGGQHGDEPVAVANEPGTRFSYSGGGFLVLEHLVETLTGKNAREAAAEWLKKAAPGITFDPVAADVAHGHFDDGTEVPHGRLDFPAFAAGGFATASAMAAFLAKLGESYRNLDGAPGIAHDTAVRMLHGQDKGARDFMGCHMGVGVFTVEAGPNRFMLHQGANEGFRALFLHCYDGPNRGDGFVILANGDNRAVPFIAEAARELLVLLRVEGVDFAKLRGAFDFAKLPREQIVNLGYKTLLLDAFLPDLPEEIVTKGPLDPLAEMNLLSGADILHVTNQRFARAENLISSHEPVFDPELFGRQGKIMDSWETARHNPAGRDAATFRLRAPSAVRYVQVSTKYHDGNQAEFIRLEGLDDGGRWHEIVPKTPMKGHALLRLEVDPGPVFSQVKIEMFPDGGVTRLGLFRELPAGVAATFRKGAESLRFDEAVPRTRKPLAIPYAPDAAEIAANRKRAPRIDHAGAAFGGRVESATNEHYSPAAQVVSPFPAIHMFDGLENARSRRPGHHEEMTLKLDGPAKIGTIVVDFTYYVNNNPLELSIDGYDGREWKTLVARINVKAYAGNVAVFPIAAAGKFEKLKVSTFPDGGINRLRVY